MNFPAEMMPSSGSPRPMLGTTSVENQAQTDPKLCICILYTKNFYKNRRCPPLTYVHALKYILIAIRTFKLIFAWI